MLGLDFGRIQFTPDLMPGDILGSNLFNFQTSQFTLTRGPVFCELLLADEINRTPPKTQAALLEAMQERAVTIDGETYRLPDHFMVIATQNPIEQQGVYPLPEAQLDRFLFKHRVELSLRSRRRRRSSPAMAPASARRGPRNGASSRTSPPRALTEAIGFVAQIPMVDEVVNYVVALVRATREAPDLEAGASPARRRDAGRRRPRPRRARRPRLCDAGRRQGAGAAGAAPPRHPLGRRRDRGPAGRGRDQPADRRDRGAALIYPTRRLILAAAAVAPAALLVGVYAPAWWTAGLGLLVLLFLLAMLDAVLGPAVRHAELGCEDALCGQRRRDLPGRALGPLHAARAPRRAWFAIGTAGPVAAPDGLRARGTMQAGRGRRHGGADRRAARHREHRHASGCAGAVRSAWSGSSAPVPLGQDVLIVPDIRPVRDKGIQMANREALYGQKAQLQIGEGAEFEALAAYRQGMDRRAIDWKQSARHASLIAKEYRTERNNNIVMALDAGRVMSRALRRVSRGSTGRSRPPCSPPMWR